MSDVTSNPADFPRSVLYAKPDSLEAVNAAAQLGADAVLVNLEKVDPARLPEARQVLSDFLTQADRSGSRPWLKLTLDQHEADIAAITGPLDYIMVPDATLENLAEVAALLDAQEAKVGLPAGSVRLNALVEDAEGLLSLREIAAMPRVQKLGIGRVDLMHQLRMTCDPEGPEITRFLVDLVVASAAVGIDPPLASLYQQADNDEGLRETTARLASIGFFGRTAVYPQHIAGLNEIFVA